MKAKKTQRETIKKILHYLKHYRFFMLLSILFAAASVALTLYAPILAGKAIDLIIGKDAVHFAGIFAILQKLALVAGMTAVLQWLMNTINNKISYHMVKDLRNTAFEKLQILPLSYLDQHTTGEIVSRIIADTDQLSDGLFLGFTQLFTGIATIIGTLIFMLTLHPGITAVVAVLTPLSLFVAKFIATHTYDMFQLQAECRAEQAGLIDEMIGNQKVVQAFSQEERVLSRFDEINGRLEKYSLKAIFFSSLTNPCTRFVNSVVYAAVGLTGAIAAVSAAISIGDLTCFLSYANQYTKPFNDISGVITELQNTLACAFRIFELIEAEPEPAEASDATVLKDISGAIHFKNVFFSYTEKKPLIENLTLSAAPGQKIAIVGPTGCGKTTLINLLMRFYDVNQGSIQIEDKDIRLLTKKSLRSSYGMVLQDTWLKTGTIRENIVLGKKDATEEEILEAAKAAHSHSFIKRLPQGYDTVIGEDGGSLSQGQKQLLCITRVMLCLPPVLILDEATSSIDTRTELQIQKAFEKLQKGRTSFIVAHRLSTIQEADNILVMKDGHIIEQGNHKELLQKKGFYASLYLSQEN